VGCCPSPGTCYRFADHPALLYFSLNSLLDVRIVPAYCMLLSAAGLLLHLTLTFYHSLKRASTNPGSCSCLSAPATRAVPSRTPLFAFKLLKVLTIVSLLVLSLVTGRLHGGHDWARLAMPASIVRCSFGLSHHFALTPNRAGIRRGLLHIRHLLR
jgi:hypothetical protein